jgi:HPt (histidine-containing phosphotransfer) domain-containing protein
MSGLTRESVISSMSAAAERMGLELEDLQEMINEVLEDCTKKAYQLKKAIENKEYDAIKAIAHDIKGSTANYGLKSVSALALTIEQNNQNAPQGSIDELIGQLERFSEFGLDQIS